MPYALRAYQQHAVTRGVQFLQSGDGQGQGGLIVQPTGSGKSLVIASTVQALDAPCLVFQPTREILEQNANKLLAYGFDPKVYSASMNSREIGQITLATIGSVRKIPDAFQQFPYVIVDEAHGVNAKEGMYRDFFAALNGVRILGLTATPFRLHSDSYGGSQLKFLTRTRPKIFTHVVAHAQVPDLIAQGFLVKPTVQLVTGFDPAQLALNSKGADYDDDSVRRYYQQVGFADRLRRVVLRLLAVGRHPILVFTRFVDEALALADAVPNVAVVTAETSPKDRGDIIGAFRRGEVPVVANCGVLTLGFDMPSLATVVLARPTLSLTVWYQQVGRVLRPHPGKDAWVVDMVGLTPRFGQIEDLRLRRGSKGQKWEMVSTVDGVEKILTNQYFESKFVSKWQVKPKWHKPKWGKFATGRS